MELPPEVAYQKRRRTWLFIFLFAAGTVSTGLMGGIVFRGDPNVSRLVRLLWWVAMACAWAGHSLMWSIVHDVNEARRLEDRAPYSYLAWFSYKVEKGCPRVQATFPQRAKSTVVLGICHRDRIELRCAQYPLSIAQHDRLQDGDPISPSPTPAARAPGAVRAQSTSRCSRPAAAR